MPTMPDRSGEVILGVDTHEREHVAALVDGLGRLLATRERAGLPAAARVGVDFNSGLEQAKRAGGSTAFLLE
jgi:hypothetical protein